MPTLDEIKHHCKHNHHPIDQNTPIESRRDDSSGLGEEAQHKHQQKVGNGDRIDRAGVAAHAPARRGEVLAAETLEAQAAYRDDVGGD